MAVTTRGKLELCRLGLLCSRKVQDTQDRTETTTHSNTCHSFLSKRGSRKALRGLSKGCVVVTTQEKLELYRLGSFRLTLVKSHGWGSLTGQFPHHFKLAIHLVSTLLRACNLAQMKERVMKVNNIAGRFGVGDFLAVFWRF